MLRAKVVSVSITDFPMSKKQDSSAAAKPEPVVFPEREEAFDLTNFACPRCSTVISAEYYGPCQQCLDSLKQAYEADRVRSEPTESEGFTPKMHVTPNAVALKDD